MVSVAAAIVAQIAITAISLSNLSQTHWVAAGFLNFSLVSALMAVYYSTTQYRILGRLLRAEQIRLWIRGGRRKRQEPESVMPHLFHYLKDWKKPRQAESSGTENLAQAARHSLKSKITNSTGLGLFGVFLKLIRVGPWAFFEEEDFYRPCDPWSFEANGIDPTKLPSRLRAACFTPSVSAVVTMSAPQALLTGSLFSLLISLGIYLGFTWTRDLDTVAGTNDSRNVFIMYTTSLGVCLVVYTLSLLIQDEDTRSEMSILNQYMLDYVHDPRNKDIVESWGYESVVEDGLLRFSFRNAGYPNTTASSRRSSSPSNAISEEIEMAQRGQQPANASAGEVV